MLLEDELPSLKYLKLLCEQIPELEILRAFISAEELLKERDSLEFDLLITDIEMPGLNGIQVAEILNDKYIIFITAYSEFAADAFDLQAVDYIRKPLKLDRLKQAIDKVAQLHSSNHRRIFISNLLDYSKGRVHGGWTGD